MEKDKQIAELFDAYNPPMSDDGIFMSRLTRRLETVEYIKTVQQQQILRHKRVVLFTFIVGLVAGVILLTCILNISDDELLFGMAPQFHLFGIISANTHAVFSILLSALLCMSIVIIVNIILDISIYKLRVDAKRKFLSSGMK